MRNPVGILVTDMGTGPVRLGVNVEVLPATGAEIARASYVPIRNVTIHAENEAGAIVVARLGPQEAAMLAAVVAAAAEEARR